jgi:hypothetical protein
MAKTIADYKKDYENAKARGDAAGMQAANDGANAIRRSEGKAEEHATADIAKTKQSQTQSMADAAKKSSSKIKEKNTGDNWSPLGDVYSGLFDSLANELETKEVYGDVQTPSNTASIIAQPKEKTSAGSNDYLKEMEKLRKAQRDARIESLKKARDTALSGLEGEESTIDPYYYDKRNQAAAASDVGALNFAQYMASRGIKGSAAGMPEIYRNASLQQQIGGLDRQQAAERSDIARRRSGIESAYASDVASAEADIEAQTMQDYINNMRTIQAQRIADNAAKGLTSTGELTLAGKNAQNSELERQAALIAQANYENIQEEIDRIAAIDPNDPLIPYLQAERQKKIKNERKRQRTENADDVGRAIDMWKVAGVASQEIADILGVPVGARTADYDLGQFNAETSRINATTENVKEPTQNESFSVLYETLRNSPIQTVYDYFTQPALRAQLINQIGVQNLPKLWNEVMFEAIQRGDWADGRPITDYNTFFGVQ